MPKRLDREAMRAELSEIVKICTAVGLDEQAEITRHWLAPSREDQRVFYLPRPVRTATDGTMVANWQKRFLAARKAYARELFEQAMRHATGLNEQAAFLLLWQVLRENPDHAGAKRALGKLLYPLEAQPKIRLAGTPHQQFGWPARSYSRVVTPHFELTTRAGRAESIKIARQLEQYFALWSQFFYPFWSPPGLLARRLTADAGAGDWPKPARIQVVLLADAEEYRQVLGAGEQNIGISVGYYAPAAKQSFFYPADDQQATFFHELTHQLLAEATQWQVVDSVGGRGQFWMVEGIALYMESLCQHDGYWTLGGVESARLQTARYRAVRDGYWPTWAEFSEGTLESWKSRSDLALLYTHAAGLTHTLLDQTPTTHQRDFPASRSAGHEAYFRALTNVYTGNASTVDLLSVLGESEEEAKLAYQQRMTLSDHDVRTICASDRQLESLVLSGSELTAESWQALARLTKLQWLDLSFSNAERDDLGWLGRLQQLQRLSLEGTRVDPRTLADIASLPELKELDLSYSPVDDRALRPLDGQRTIETLWLTATQISDAALETLASMPALTQCDTRESKVTVSAWNEFKKLHHVGEP